MRFARAVAAAGMAALLLAGCSSPRAPYPTGPPPADPSAPLALHTWTSTPDPPLSGRNAALGGWLRDRFVVVGGYDTRICPAGASCTAPSRPALRDGATFDPERGIWSPIARAPDPIDGQSAVVDGRLYVLTSGYENNGHPSALLRYDPAADRWDRLPVPPKGEYFTLVPAGDNLLTIAGSDENGRTVDQAFDPASGRWRTLPDDPLGQSFDRFAVWAGDRLVLAAKSIADLNDPDGPALVRLAYLDADLTTWTRGPATETIGWNPVWSRGRVVWPEVGSADGGEVKGWGRSYPYGAILDPADGRWSSLPGDREQVGDHPLDGQVVDAGVISGADLVDPVTRDVTDLPDLPGPTRTGATTVSGDRFVLLWGGGVERSGGPPENQDTGVLLRVR